jgi:hypothetical protein
LLIDLWVVQRIPGSVKRLRHRRASSPNWKRLRERRNFMTRRGDEIMQNSPLCPISPKNDALKFDYSVFDGAPAIHTLGIFHSFISVISFPTLCAARCRRTTSEEELARLYHIPIPEETDLPISYNIAPSQKVLTIRFNPQTRTA